MTYIFASDVHIGWKLFNIPELADDLKDVFSNIVNTCITKKVDALVLVGDIFDNNRPSEENVIFVRSAISKLNEAGVLVYAIAGDHDMSFNGKHWITDVCGALPMSVCCGKFFGVNFTNFMNLPEVLKDIPADMAKNIEFLCFHGQVQKLFPFVDEKKRLDFENVDLSKFTNLKGVVLGDLHIPYEATIRQSADTPPIFLGYCGSPGIVKSDEIGTKTGLLYFNGSAFERLPLEYPREIIRFSIDDQPTAPVPSPSKGGKKPVYLLEYSPENKDQLKQYVKLYESGIVRFKPLQKNGKTEVVNIRSEIKTSDRIAGVINQLETDEELRSLALNLINSADPKTVLDGFKAASGF